MSPWLLAQIVYAGFAWWLCSRSVMRSSLFGAFSGRDLAATIRELRAAGRERELSRLVTLLDSDALAPLLEHESFDAPAEQLVDHANQASRLAAPPVRVLRSLATLGTMLGLLAAVASLRSGLDANTSGALQTAAARALDSAVLGFVTALPCWTAAALCGRRARQTDVELESVLLAMTSNETNPSEPASDASTDKRSDPSQPVDEREPGR